MANSFSVFINFDGKCREAVTFYAKAFNSEVRNLMTYGDTPADSGYTVAAADKEKIMYCDVPICGCDVMFCDFTSDMTLTMGGNISPTLSFGNEDEIRRVFGALKEGGEVYEELKKTFFGDLYGMIKDRYGIVWQLIYNEG